MNHFAPAVADWAADRADGERLAAHPARWIRVDAWQVRLRNVLVALSGRIDRHRARIHLLSDAQVRT